MKTLELKLSYDKCAEDSDKAEIPDIPLPGENTAAAGAFRGAAADIPGEVLRPVMLSLRGGLSCVLRLAGR
jgi:hypothetical protein